MKILWWFAKINASDVLTGWKFWSIATLNKSRGKYILHYYEVGITVLMKWQVEVVISVVVVLVAVAVITNIVPDLILKIVYPINC